MRHVVNVACAVIILLFFSSCMMNPVSITGQVMEAKYKRDMEKQLRERVDYSKREQDLLEKKREYEQKNMTLSLAVTCAGLSEVYFRTFKFGQSLEYGEKGLQLIRQIEAQKLENLNDDGQGKTLEEYLKEDQQLAKLRRQAAEIASYNLKSQLTLQFNRKKKFLEAQKDIYNWLANNYKIVGDQAKEKEFHSLSRHAQVDLMNISFRQTVFLIPYNQALADKDARYLETLEQMEDYSKNIVEYRLVGDRMELKPQYAQKTVPDAATEAQAEYMAKIDAYNRLYDQIMKENLRGNVRKVEALIEEYSPGGDTLASSAMSSMKIQASILGSQSQAEQIEKYIETYINIPKSMIIKAWLYNEVGRKEKATHLVNEAVRIFSDRKMPKLDYTSMVLTGFDPMRSFVDQNIPKPHEVPLAWRLLQASLLTDLGDEQAVVLWESIIRDVTEFNSLNRNDKTHLSYADSRNKIVLNAYRRLSQIYERIGNGEKAAACIDRVLQKRDSARATFSTESYKMGYLLENKDLYERYIALQGSDGFQNLIAMELAKSRAMADLMAGRVAVDANEPLLKRIVARQAIQAVDLQTTTVDPTKRALTVMPADLSQDIEKLKQSRPELYSLISAEALTREELATLIPADTAVLSYYVSDDGLYINLFQADTTVLKKVAIPKMGVYSHVYGFRNAINKPQEPSRKEKVGLDIGWKTDGQKEKLIVKNSMAFAVEIVNVDLITNQSIWQTIDTGYDLGKHRVKIDLSTKTIQPGKAETIFETTIDPAGRKMFDQQFVIATNIGTFRLKGYLELGSDGQWNIRETDRSPTYWAMKKMNLFDILIAPVAEYIHAGHLVIVPHGALHFLPFEALQDSDGKYLIEKYAVSYAPSLSVLKYCKQKNTGRKDRLAAFGDPLGDLAFAKTEVNGLRDLFPDSAVFTGREVTLEKVVVNTKDRDVIHFACHGVFNTDSPFDSALLLHGPDGTAQLLTVSRILGMKIQPYLVTLSACDTGLARISGADELLGLVRGFFVAGSPSLVTTLWPIDDQSTSLLMHRFYENLMKKNMNKAAALRDAKLHLLNAGYESPYYWAAFILQGDSI